MNPYLALLRPKQWPKNAFVLAGLVFAGRFTDPDSLVRAFLGAALFCMASSAVYVVNDILDLEEDRRHPLKAKRPLASGRAKIAPALTLGLFLAAGSLVGSFVLGSRFLAAVGSYMAVNVFYSRFLKHVVILDVLVLSFGFVIRAVAGGFAIDVEISPWLLICTTLLSLFLGISKRRHELVLLGATAHHHRPILAEYSERMLDQMIAVVTSSTVMAYSLYTFTSHEGRTRAMMLTIPFVLYGVFRYLYIVYSKNEAGSPEEVLLRDKPLLFNILAWGAACAAITYWSRG